MSSILSNTKEKYIIEFYNMISDGYAESIDDVPVSVMTFLSNMTHEELVTPFIVEEFKQRTYRSVPILMDRYKVGSYSFVPIQSGS